jgi:hypothetical protein
MRELHNKVQRGRATPLVCTFNQIASAQILEIEIQVGNSMQMTFDPVQHLLYQRNDQTASKQKEAPVPTILVQINDVSSDSLLTKEVLPPFQYTCRC